MFSQDIQKYGRSRICFIDTVTSNRLMETYGTYKCLFSYYTATHIYTDLVETIPLKTQKLMNVFRVSKLHAIRPRTLNHYPMNKREPPT